jgi:hypothetical protein
MSLSNEIVYDLSWFPNSVQHLSVWSKTFINYRYTHFTWHNAVFTNWVRVLKVIYQRSLGWRWAYPNLRLKVCNRNTFVCTNILLKTFSKPVWGKQTNNQFQINMQMTSSSIDSRLFTTMISRDHFKGLWPCR